MTYRASSKRDTQDNVDSIHYKTRQEVRWHCVTDIESEETNPIVGVCVSFQLKTIDFSRTALFHGTSYHDISGHEILLQYTKFRHVSTKYEILRNEVNAVISIELSGNVAARTNATYITNTKM
jgi:hypothetical protein